VPDRTQPWLNRRTLLRAAALLILIVVGAALRLPTIGRDALWFDESLTARIVSKPVVELVDMVRQFEQTPPAYYLLLRPWVLLFGDSENAIRVPSAICGLLAIGGMFLLIGRMFGDIAGFVAASILVLSPFHIAYSQEARAYSLLVLLTIVSCDLFVRMLDERCAWLDAGYVIVATLLPYTHLYGFFILAAQQAGYWTAVLTRRPTPLKPDRWVLLTAIVAMLYTPWIRIVLVWLREVRGWFWQQHSSWYDIPWAYVCYLGSTPFVLSLAVLAALAFWRHRSRRIELLTFALVALLPVVIPVTTSMLIKPTFSPRYGIAAMVGVTALGAAGVSAFKPLWIRGTIALAILLVAMTPTTFPEPKADWFAVAAYLRTQVRPGDSVFLNRKWTTIVYDRYVHLPGVQRTGFEGSALPVTLPLDDDKHAWLVLHMNQFPDGAFIRRGNWRIVGGKMFRGVFVLELANPVPPATTRDSQM